MWPTRPTPSASCPPGAAHPSSCSAVASRRMPCGRVSGSRGLAVAARELEVDLGVGPDAGQTRVVDLAPDLAGHPGDERPGRDDRTLGHDGAGGDEAAGADAGAVEHDRAHPDEAVVLDGAAVEHGAVSDRDA